MSETECHVRGLWTGAEGEMTDESAKDCGIQKLGLELGVGRRGLQVD